MSVAGRIARRALVIAQTPFFPANRPSRSRLAEATSFLRAVGFDVDVVLHLVESDFLAQPAVSPNRAPPVLHGRMVTVLSGDGGASGNAGGWSSTLDICLDSLCRAERYHAMWMSGPGLARAVAYAPAGCVTIIDIRGGPRTLAPASARPDVFVTDDRSATIASAASRPPLSIAVPWMPEAPARRPPCATWPKLRAGFIGRDSPLNRETVRHFLRRLEDNSPCLRDCLTVVVAGTVSRYVRPVPGWIETLGPVPCLEHFYGAIDVVVAPFTAAVSPRPQVAEALAWNLPVIATANASAGLPVVDPAHAVPDVDGVVGSLATLAFDTRGRRTIAAAASRGAANLRAAKLAGLATLRRAISPWTQRFVILTDVAVWRRETLAEERGRQIIEYFAHVMPVSVIHLGARRIEESEVHLTGVSFTSLGGVADIGPAINALIAREHVAGCLVSLAGAGSIPAVALPRFCDHWPARAAAAPSPIGALARPDLELDDATAVFATPLLHLPAALDWRLDLSAPALLLLLIDENADAALVDILGRMSPIGLAVVRSRSLATDANVYACLKAMPRPAAIATLETSALSRELAATLAARAGIPSFHLGGEQYPMLVGGRMIANVVRHIAAVAGLLRTETRSLQDSRPPDQGWSRLWERLAEHRIVSRKGMEKSSRAAA